MGVILLLTRVILAEVTSGDEVLEVCKLPANHRPPDNELKQPARETVETHCVKTKYEAFKPCWKNTLSLLFGHSCGLGQDKRKRLLDKRRQSGHEDVGGGAEFAMDRALVSGL